MHRGAALLLAGLAIGAGPLAAAPTRVASINLCADALLFDLAEPSQIASVTELSRDPVLSVHAERARALPVNRGRAEEIFALKPDLVLADAASATTTVALLRRLGLRVETLDAAATLPEVLRIVHRAGALLGQPARADALAARLAALATTPHATPRTALIVQPAGYVPGPDTLGPTLLALAGLRDLAPTLGLARGGFVTIEHLILARPAYLVHGSAAPAGRALADDFLQHPALTRARQLHGGMRPVAISDAAWACGSDALRDAVLGLRAAVREAPP